MHRGQLIFITDDINHHWNGSLDDAPCGIGVYIYYVKYSGESDGVIISGEVKGNVTLLK